MGKFQSAAVYKKQDKMIFSKNKQNHNTYTEKRRFYYNF